MKINLFKSIILIKLFFIKVLIYSQIPFCDTISVGYPLSEALDEFILTVHKNSSSIALIDLSINKLTENKQKYRISTFFSPSLLLDYNVLKYGNLGNDYIFFTIAYNRQILNRCDLLNDEFYADISGGLCHTIDYWEVTIKRDKYYRINKTITGHQTYRKGKKIHIHRPKPDD